MKSFKQFLCDDHARIPFSVIGVFLILGSSFTTVYVSQLEQETAFEVASTLDFNEVENLIRYAEADIATALNIAGMKGLKEIGKNPVISVIATPEYGSSADEVNQNRVREYIMKELNIYLTSHYLYDSFNDGRYAINVVIPDGKTYPITDMEDISFSTLVMKFTRPTNDIPLIDGILGPDGDPDHDTYWTAELPILTEIRKLNNATGESEFVTTRALNVSSIITSRYPLLKSLVEEYNHTINGTFTPLWTFTTILANIYSLARGYKHYSSGKPLNVVDNKHLALIANGGLLLEQSLVFSSVDPLALVDFGINTVKTLKNKDQNPLSGFNGMDPEGFKFNPGDLSKGSANFDAGDDENTTIDDCPHINISEIAEVVLYNVTAVTLTFYNETFGIVEDTITITDDPDFNQEEINRTVCIRSSQGYILVDTEKHLITNETTENLIDDIIDEMYHANLSTAVTNRNEVLTINGDPGVNWTDGGQEPTWHYIGFTAISKDIVKPAKGLVAPGCPLYDEKYNVSWQKTHYYYRDVLENISGNWTLVRYWNNKTDHMWEEVTLNVILDHYAWWHSESLGDFEDDVVDIMYHNATVGGPDGDPNLEDTLTSYLSIFTDLNNSKVMLIETYNNEGTRELEYVAPGNYNNWVADESWTALNEILDMIKEIKQYPSINSTAYPNPIILIREAKEDLANKFDANMTNGIYHNLSAYQTGSEFSSVGKKAVYFIRDWYVNKVRNDIDNVFSNIESQIDDALSDVISDIDGVDFSADDIKNTLSGSAMDTLSNQFAIPFGFDVSLDSNLLDEEGKPLWNETVRLAVDQFPNYLDAFEQTTYKGVDYWSLGVKNLCTLGPTGFPILPPTPVTPWIVTINVWVIDVKGEYAEFKVIDSTDETLFNPLFGHDPQVYLRKTDRISNMDDTIVLGYNTRLNFEFTTVAFGVVPSWGMMVGDIEGGWEEQNGLK